MNLKKWIALLTVLSLCLACLAGCSHATDESDSSSQETEASSDASSGTSSEASAEASKETSADASSQVSSDTASSDVSSSAEETYVPFDYSTGIDDTGHFAWTASDGVALCEYKGIVVPDSYATVSQSDIDAQIQSILSSYTTTSHVTDRAVKDGDTVNIDYVGYIGEEAFDGGSTNGAGTTVTIGVTSYIDDFLQQLIGHMPGETFDVNVTFPEDYGVDSLNGKDAKFVTTINYISESVTPELTDEFVSTNLKEAYGASTVAELNDAVMERILASTVKDYLTQYLISNSTCSVPDELREYVQNICIDYYTSYASAYGMTIEDFLSSYLGVSTVDELLEAQKENIDYMEQRTMVFMAIAEKESLSVDESDIESMLLYDTGSRDDSALKEQYGLPYLLNITLQQKALDLVYENALVNPSVTSSDDAESSSSSGTEP